VTALSEAPNRAIELGNRFEFGRFRQGVTALQAQDPGVIPRNVAEDL
jgi:hypothetical protein